VRDLTPVLGIGFSFLNGSPRPELGALLDLSVGF